MEIETLRKETHTLEQALARALSPLLEGFQTRTGIAVAGVDVGLCDITRMGGFTTAAVTDVKVRLDLCL